MKNMHVLAFTALFCLNVQLAVSQNAKVTLDKNAVPLSTLLSDIEHQTNYLFVVNSQVDTNRKVSIKVNQTALSSVLKDIFANTNVHYAVEGTHIILSEKKENAGSQEQITVSGQVVDAQKDPLYGVNVFLKGTTQGVITDFDGKFSLIVPKGSSLTFSYIGFQSQTVEVGKSKSLNITLVEDSKALGEVVVTAMGIERKSETLTYSTQTVGGNELTRSKESNLINSLQGKSAGLIITPNTGGAGSASKILLRGNASMLGNNSPLIVVDGVPMTNSVNSQLGLDGGANLMAGASEGGDALSQLNPDDIASITVLKGANSAALYGSKASNGVLMITTKKGQQGALHIDVSSSTVFETPLVLPKLQNTYGSVVVGTNETGYYIEQGSWGAKLSQMTADQMNPAYASQRLTNKPYQISDFFRTGTNLNNTISFSGGTEKVQSYFSYGNTTAKGIMPKNDFYRHNLMLRENFSFFEKKLKVNLSANYINQKAENRPESGLYSVLSNLYTSSRNADLDYYRKNFSAPGSWVTSPYQVFVTNTYKKNGEDVEVTELGNITTTLNGEKQQWYMQDAVGKNNPWWQLNRNTSFEETNHFLANLGFTYDIFDGLSLQARMKYDYSNITSESRQTATTMLPSSMSERGRLIWSNSYSRDFYGDFMLNYGKQIQDFYFSVNAGGSVVRSLSNYWCLTPAASSGKPYQEDLSFNQFVLSDIYINGGYGSDITSGGLESKNWETSLFATGQLSYKDLATIEGSYRIDWYRAFTQFKELSPAYGYFSVGANSMISKLFNMPEPISNLKIRASYSEVGNSIPNSLFLQSATRNPATGAYIMAGTTAFKDPKPETTASFETGFELGLFNHSINFDFTYYHAMMRAQYMSYAGASGKTVYKNAGKVLNQGVELTTSYILAPNTNFSWKTAVNFSFNNNKIITTVKKDNGTDLIREVDLGNSSGLKVKFIPGGSYGDLYATDFLRDEDGNIRINKSSGRPFLDQSSSSLYLGNMNAKYNLGWSNTFNYKDFTFYFLVDGKIGGKVVSFTESLLDYYGVSENTAKMRLKAENQNLVWTNKKGESYPGIVMSDGNITSLEAYYAATSGATPFGQNYVYNATNFRMREISAAYTLRDLFGKSKNLTVSVNARNLFFLYKEAPIDPETSMSTQNALGNVDVFSMPTTRTFGFSVKASF